MCAARLREQMKPEQRKNPRKGDYIHQRVMTILPLQFISLMLNSRA
ncbi:hypothetical protein ACMBCN_02765 [Candidatus Liberibacter asiaticus]